MRMYGGRAKLIANKNQLVHIKNDRVAMFRLRETKLTHMIHCDVRWCACVSFVTLRVFQ